MVRHITTLDLMWVHKNLFEIKLEGVIFFHDF